MANGEQFNLGKEIGNIQSSIEGLAKGFETFRGEILESNKAQDIKIEGIM